MSENGDLRNDTPSDSKKMDISEISDHRTLESDQSAGDAAGEKGAWPQGPADTSTVANVTDDDAVTAPGRGRADSALSLEGLDLELPTLDSYQEEYVEFPSSPKHLKECFEANGVPLPLEGDSGTAGRSEEDEEEDTSIYQAVLSPDCRDVRLRKEDVSAETTENIINAILAEDDEDDEEDCDVMPENKGSGVGLSPEATPRRLLMPNLHELSLAEVYDSGGSGPKVVLERSEEESVSRARDGQATSSTPEGEAGRKCEAQVEENGFVVERYDSSLARRQYGRHVITGLFVESRGGALPLKRLIAPQKEILDSPVEEEEPADAQAWPRPAGGSGARQSAPVPSARTKPVPSPRTLAGTGSSRQRGPAIILDASKLDLKLARRTPQVNDDGSVEELKERPGTLVPPHQQRGGRRKIRVSEEIFQGPGGDDSVSSGGESRLSDTDMVSPDDADLDELLSPDLDTPDEMEDSIMERLSETLPPAEPIPELSAAEEKAEARNWRSCVVAGLERHIDMKVIDPYKRVLSHGGYLNEGSHNAIIVFSACYLPDRSRVDYDYVMDNLFLYVLTTLDQLITEDYVLVYLHGATARGCMPTFSWFKRCYQMIDRRLRKNLKKLYLVHPTFWLKTFVIMTRPFISSKFARKLAFVETLADLSGVVPLEQASIPDRVKQLDDELERSRKKPEPRKVERDKFGDPVR